MSSRLAPGFSSSISDTLGELYKGKKNTWRPNNARSPGIEILSVLIWYGWTIWKTSQGWSACVFSCSESTQTDYSVRGRRTIRDWHAVLHRGCFFLSRRQWVSEKSEVNWIKFWKGRASMSRNNMDGRRVISAVYDGKMRGLSKLSNFLRLIPLLCYDIAFSDLHDRREAVCPSF